MNRIVSLIIAALSFLMLFGILSTPVHAAKAGQVMLRTNGTDSRYDITGDGKKDKIQFVYHKKYSFADQLSIKINGKTALLLKNTCIDSTEVKAYIVTLNNGKKLMYLEAFGGDPFDGVLSGLYRYSAGKLICDVNYLKLKNRVVDRTYKVRAIGNNTVRVWCYCSSPGLARFTAYVDAVYSNGKVSLKNTYFKISSGSGQYGGMQNNLESYVMAKTVQGYYYSDCNSKRFMVRAGHRVKLLTYRLIGKRNRILVQLINGKKVWIDDVVRATYEDDQYLLRDIRIWV